MTGRMATAAWLCLCFVALLVGALPVQAQSSGTLVGQVANGTSGGAAVGAGLLVVLHIAQEGAERDSLQTTTDGQGTYEFAGLDTDPALSYTPEVQYQGVVYRSSQEYSFEEGQSELDTAITVYETTDDSAGVRVDSVHMIAESFEQVLRISEVYTFGNVTDRAFVGKANEASDGRLVTLFIPLPKSAVGLAFSDEAAGRFIEVEGGIWDTEPVPPGADTLIVRFSYHVLVEGDSVPLERAFDYPVSIVNLLAVQPGLTLRGSQLAAGDSIAFGEKEYAVYEATGLGPDTPLSIELVPSADSAAAALPASPGGIQVAAEPGQPGKQGVLRWLGFGLAGLAVLGALAYPFATRPRSRE